MIRYVIFATAMLSLSGCGVGDIQQLDDRAGAALADIEVQLQRRADLVPNLIETVQARIAVEPEAIQALADARAGLVSALKSGDLGQIEDRALELSGAIQRLMAFAGRDSALRTDASFQLIESQLEGTSAEIDIACRDYNEAVEEYNAYIEAFPQSVTAKVIGAEPREHFRPMGEDAGAL